MMVSIILIFGSLFNFNQLSCDNFANLISINELIKSNNKITYTKFKDSLKQDYKMFPLDYNFDEQWYPKIPESFILSIKNGKVYSQDGIVIIDNNLINELIWPWSILKSEKNFNLDILPKLKKINGRLLVITQEGVSNYYHWVTEVLPKFALLEKKQIQYDYIYLPISQPFQKKYLELLDIDISKVISPFNENIYIEADELIVPSFVSQSCFTPKWVIDYLRNKFIPLAEKIITKNSFAKKIFISRKKASYRRIINEDEVFEKFEKIGFKRYNLEDLSILDQINLFKNADIIIAPHGAGLVNLIFCKPDVQIIELYQAHKDETFWYLSQVVGIRNYLCIKTTEFIKNGGYTDTVVPSNIVDDIVKKLI